MLRFTCLVSILKFAAVFIMLAPPLAIADISGLRANFQELRSDMPKNTLSELLQYQENLLETIAVASNMLAQVENGPQSVAREDATNRSLPTHPPVRINVIPIGFSVEAVDVMDEYWIKLLSRNEQLRLHERGRTDASDVSLTTGVSFKFKLIRTSFHLQRVIRSFLNQNARKRSSSQNSYYVTTFEMSYLLQDLYSTMEADSGFSDSIPSSLTVFVINTPREDASLARFGYAARFSTADYEELTSNTSIMTACTSIYKDIVKIRTKIELDESPDQRLDRHYRWEESSTNQRWTELASGNLHAGDAIRSSREWSIKKMQTIDALVRSALPLIII
jgi:hypothetical protein